MQPYERPTIVEMGSVADVTRGISRERGADNFFPTGRRSIIGGGTPTS